MKTYAGPNHPHCPLFPDELAAAAEMVATLETEAAALLAKLPTPLAARCLAPPLADVAMAHRWLLGLPKVAHPGAPHRLPRLAPHFRAWADREIDPAALVAAAWWHCAPVRLSAGELVLGLSPTKTQPRRKNIELEED